MHRKQRDRMRVKNQKFQKNSRSKSQTTKSKKSEAEKSASQRKPNCPIRNESQHSGQRFWSECWDKVLSSRELRPNIQTIYQWGQCSTESASRFENRAEGSNKAEPPWLVPLPERNMP